MKSVIRDFGRFGISGVESFGSAIIVIVKFSVDEIV
jgi:hypothetical protein